MDKLRLDRYLANMNIGSRSEVKQYIRKGEVRVNDKVITTSDYKVDENDAVTYQGQTVGYHPYAYYMLYKPAGCVSATQDNTSKTVLEYIQDPIHKDLFPVGRLDKDSEGLLIVTNDGELSHNLLSPKKHVDKTYYAEINGIIVNEDIISFQSGLDIGDDKPTLPATLIILSVDISTQTSRIQVTIHEGRYHQVKRMVQAVGKQVTYLKRLTMGGLHLDESLAPGEYRNLTAGEISLLYSNNVAKY